MKRICRPDPEFDESRFIVVDKYELRDVATLLRGVMRSLHDNRPVTAAFKLQDVEDIIKEYQRENQRLVTTEEEEA